MQVKDFDYSLPPELIAQFPADQRDASRMMVLDRKNGAISDERFKSLSNYLRAGDLLVMNDTRVIPARLFGHKQTGGRVEVFLVRRCAGTDEKWHCLIKGSKGLKEGAVLAMSGGMQALSACGRIRKPGLSVFSVKNLLRPGCRGKEKCHCRLICSALPASRTANVIRRSWRASPGPWQRRRLVCISRKRCWIR
jgi:hypothetical protein